MTAVAVLSAPQGPRLAAGTAGTRGAVRVGDAPSAAPGTPRARPPPPQPGGTHQRGGQEASAGPAPAAAPGALLVAAGGARNGRSLPGATRAAGRMRADGVRWRFRGRLLPARRRRPARARLRLSGPAGSSAAASSALPLSHQPRREPGCSQPGLALPVAASLAGEKPPRLGQIKRPRETSGDLRAQRGRPLRAPARAHRLRAGGCSPAS